MAFSLSQMNLQSILLTAGMLFGVSVYSASTDQPISVRLLGEPKTLDWTLADSAIDAAVLRNIMDGLTTIDESGVIAPALAEKWDISVDKKTYTFHLRKNAKWSDGVPVTAPQFVDSWKRLLSPINGANYAFLLNNVQGALEFNKGKGPWENVQIKSLDANTLQVTLLKPLASWIYFTTVWSTYPIRLDLIQKFGDTWARPGALQVTGPYVIVSRDEGQKMVLKRNKLYWGVPAKTQDIHFKFISDPVESVSRMQAGSVDVIPRLVASNMPAQIDPQKIVVASSPGKRTIYLEFNLGKYPISERPFRMAIAQAIDPKVAAKNLGEYYAPATSFVLPSMLGYDSRPFISFNPKEAVKLLAQSGYVSTPDSKLRISVLGYSDLSSLAKSIKTQIESNLGLQVELTEYKPSELSRMAMNTAGADIMLFSILAKYPDPDHFLSIFEENGKPTAMGWYDVRYENLLEKGRTEMNSSVRNELYLQAQKLLIGESVAVLPLAYEIKNSTLVRKGVKGFEQSPFSLFSVKNLRWE